MDTKKYVSVWFCSPNRSRETLAHYKVYKDLVIWKRYKRGGIKRQLVEVSRSI